MSSTPKPTSERNQSNCPSPPPTDRPFAQHGRARSHSIGETASIRAWPRQTITRDNIATIDFSGRPTPETIAVGTFCRECLRPASRDESTFQGSSLLEEIGRSGTGFATGHGAISLLNYATATTGEDDRVNDEKKPHPVVSIVIPVFNSQETIGPLVEELIDMLAKRLSLQIVLVDDSSSDQSAAVCRALHQRHPQTVDFVMLSRNFGEHNAVMAGLNQVEGDYCVIMDDDFQNPPQEVSKLLDEIQRGHDVVYVQYAVKHHSLWRNLGSRLHNWMATKALGKPKNLYLSSFKAINRFVVQEAIQYTGPDPYLDAIILRTTRNIGVVAAEHIPRQNGTSGYTIRKLIALWGNMIVAFSFYPLRLLGLYGLAMTTVGVGYGIYTCASYFIDSIPDPNSIDRLTASLWFFRGVQLLFVGIVGEYVGRIYKLLKREPQYVVRQFTSRTKGITFPTP